MQVLTVTGWDEERQFAALSFAHNRRFTDFLKMGIKPLAYREYDTENRRWRVHLSKLPLVLNYARRCFAQVDYRVLPEWVQMLVAAARSASGSDTPLDVPPRPQESPYSLLYVLPTAPWEVVRAAYKALVVMHHPDHGGDEEVLKRINRAYTELEDRHTKKLTPECG
jgi:hypothetical protein